MLELLIKVIEYLGQDVGNTLKGVIEMDAARIYLSYHSNKAACIFPFLLANIVKFTIISSAAMLLLNMLKVNLILMIISYLLIFFLFLLVGMGVYGTDTGDYIKINTHKNIGYKCIHKEALKSMFSFWHLQSAVTFAVQAAIIWFAIVAIKYKYNPSTSIIIVLVGLSITFIFWGIKYIIIPKDDVISAPFDAIFCVVYADKSKEAAQYKCQDVIVTIQKNNDILLRNRAYAYYVTKMVIIKADSIDYIQIADTKIKLINNKWTII